MMFDRSRVNFWARIVAIGLAAVFLGSFIFMGIGTNVNYNLFDLIGGNSNQPQPQTTSLQEQIRQTEKDLKQNPGDADTRKTLAGLYFQNGQLEDATRVLQAGVDRDPKDAEMRTMLGQVYLQRAQAAPEKEQKELYGKAGDAFAAATEIEPKNEQAYLAAGEAYERAGQPDQAIKYWNGYLDLNPKGPEAEAVKERISALLKGGTTTGGGESTRP